MSTVFRGIPVSEGIVASETVKYGLSTTLLYALEVFKGYVEKVMEMVNESEKELLQAYILMAKDLVNESIEIASNEKICGELIIKRVFEKYSAMLRSAGQV